MKDIVISTFNNRIHYFVSWIGLITLAYFSVLRILVIALIVAGLYFIDKDKPNVKGKLTRVHEKFLFIAGIIVFYSYLILSIWIGSTY